MARLRARTGTLDQSLGDRLLALRRLPAWRLLAGGPGPRRGVTDAA
jgi:hypothetical protein